MVNYRGSTGYGQKFADAIFRDQNGGEAERRARRRGRGAGAVSRGSTATAWASRAAATAGSSPTGSSRRRPRFKAAIPSAGISNLVSTTTWPTTTTTWRWSTARSRTSVPQRRRGAADHRHAVGALADPLCQQGEDADAVRARRERQRRARSRRPSSSTSRCTTSASRPTMLRYPREGHGLRETAPRRRRARAIDRLVPEALREQRSAR